MPDIDLQAWAEATAREFRNGEFYGDDPEAALVRFTLARLANDWLPGSPEIVHMLACRHEGL